MLTAILQVISCSDMLANAHVEDSQRLILSYIFCSKFWYLINNPKVVLPTLAIGASNWQKLGIKIFPKKVGKFIG